MTNLCQIRPNPTLKLTWPAWADPNGLGQPVLAPYFFKEIDWAFQFCHEARLYMLKWNQQFLPLAFAHSFYKYITKGLFSISSIIYNSTKINILLSIIDCGLIFKEILLEDNFSENWSWTIPLCLSKILSLFYFSFYVDF